MKASKYVLFLKYAIFKGSTKEALFEFKQTEIDNSGFMFWGYGGFDLTPAKNVLPFLELAKKNKSKVYVYFCQTKTYIKEGYKEATLISHDNKEFFSVPKGITLHGDKYAFVMRNLKTKEFKLNLFNYDVFQKESTLADLIYGYRHKGLGILNKNKTKEKNVLITHLAELVDCVYSKCE